MEKGERFDDKTRAGLNVLHICTGANGELKFLVTFLKIIGFEKGRELVKQGDNKEVTPLERANKEKGNASQDTIKKLYRALDENNKSKYDELIDDAEQEIERSNMKILRVSTPVQTQTIGDWRTDENEQYNDSLSVDEKNRFLDKHADLQQFAYRLPETRDNPMGDDDAVLPDSETTRLEAVDLARAVAMSLEAPTTIPPRLAPRRGELGMGMAATTRWPSDDEAPTRPQKRQRSSSGGKKHTRRRVKKSSKKKLGYKLINTRKQK